MHHIKFSEKEIKLLIETFENSRNAVLSIENKLKIKIKSTQLPSKNEVFTNQVKEYFEKILQKYKYNIGLS